MSESNEAPAGWAAISEWSDCGIYGPRPVLAHDEIDVPSDPPLGFVYGLVSTTNRVREGWPRHVQARLAIDGRLRIVTSETVLEVELLEYVIREARMLVSPLPETQPGRPTRPALRVQEVAPVRFKPWRKPWKKST